MRTVLFVFGTRPEAIKLAPVIEAARKDPALRVRVCVTGQHREMLAQVLELFEIEPDVDLDIMQPAQSLTDVAVAVLAKLVPVLRELRPDLVIVQGDTTSAFAAGLAAFYAGIEVAHVEAGLRSGDPQAPWPEEVNRRLLTVVTQLHFAPTEGARLNLLREGVDPARIHVTGNSVIDALQKAVGRLDGDTALRERLEAALPFLDTRRRLILVTGHRRENFGPGFESICAALARLVREHEDIEIVYPVHLNPNVREPVHRMLGDSRRIHLLEPVDYLSFVYLMTRSDLILSDSGGVQEEAPTLGKPVLVMRDTTERPEAVRSGNVRLVGTRCESIVEEASRLLRDDVHRASMSRPSDVFGDGRAAERIAAVLSDHSGDVRRDDQR